jgi:hypothetical protein
MTGGGRGCGYVGEREVLLGITQILEDAYPRRLGELLLSLLTGGCRVVGPSQPTMATAPSWPPASTAAGERLWRLTPWTRTASMH